MQTLPKIGWFGLFSLIAVGITGCSRRRDGAQIISEVQNRIRADGRMQTARVQVVASAGVVTLGGYVISSDQRAATVQDAARVRGVRVVIDNLRIVHQAIHPAMAESNSQPPIMVTQKPSPSVPWRRNPLADRAGIRTEPNVARLTAPPTTEQLDPPAVQSVAVTSARVTTAPPVSPTRPPVTQVLPERHVIGTRVPVIDSDLTPVALPPSPGAGISSPDAPEPMTLPTGTELVIRLTESLSSDINEKGDTFLASLASPVMNGGRVVIPEGADVEGRVVEVQSAGRFTGRPKLTIELIRLTYSGKIYQIRSSQYAKQGTSRNARTVAAIGGGAGAGAILGAILGGGRGAAIGSILGAAAGTGAEAAGQVAQVRIPAESMLNLRLRAPLTVIPSSTLQRTHTGGPSAAQDPFSTDEDRPVLKRRPGSPPATDTSTPSSPPVIQ